MKNKSYTTTIVVAHSANDVFNHIIATSKWWGGGDLEGSSTKLYDEFTIKHEDAHFSRQQLIEVVPDKKIVWLVTESNLNWLEKDKHEWTNTKMVFEITTDGDKTVLNFTHEGLVPEQECYSRCSQGWELVIKEWLYNFILTTKIS